MRVTPKTLQLRTKPWIHQGRALDLSWDKEAFALLMEQGTGKTKVIIDTAAMLYAARKIEALVVLSPEGVQRAWVRDEVPKHMSGQIPVVSAWWKNKKTKTLERMIDALYDPRFAGLRVFTVNYEMLITKAGREALKDFLKRFACLIAADESHKIKTPSAARTKACLDLSVLAPYRRIVTGTPATKAPFNLFSQFRFIDEEILQIKSYTAFKAQYAEMVQDDDPDMYAVMRHIKERIKHQRGAQAKYFTPQIVKKDEHGLPLYRNLDELQRLIAPHSFRALKKDCMDLPPKVWEKRYVELAPEQRRVYDELCDEFFTIYKGRAMSATLKITRCMRLQQVTGGFFQTTGEEAEPIGEPKDNPKLRALLDILEDVDGKLIIWARFKEELRMIARALEDTFGVGTVARYWGDIKSGNPRDKEKKKFIDSRFCSFFVGQVGAGGTGLDGLQVAKTVIYYSNDFSLENRIQSEDRAHRGGSEAHDKVTIYDIEAEDTLDQKIINTLRANKDMANVIVGDDPTEWI